MLEIRREENSDKNEVFRIHQDGFQRNDEAELVDKLRKNNQFNSNLSFVALVDKKIVGHILFTPIQINYPLTSQSISSLALAPIAILTEYQKRGIGSKLIEYALNELKLQGFTSIIVLGHEHFYPKFGFVPAKKYNIRAPFPLENDNCFMALELIPQTFPLNNFQLIIMPITKRTTKTVSYAERDDDDDDFVSTGDNTKKNRNVKSNDSVKSTTEQSSKKHDKKLCTLEKKEPVLIPSSTKENPIVIDDKESTNSQSTVSSNDSKSSSQNLTDLDDQEETSSPKNKRMKHEEDDTNENQSNGENEEEVAPSKQIEAINKKNEIPVISSIDLNKSLTSSNQTSDLPKKRSSGPLGFPTSKINIPSPNVPRVGLSRKSSTIKPLHPNFTSHVVHE
ncbi:unnamed protein product [Adineta steineri]|uniref:N-acetyltransferase domain-containing protein n=1 Tax=Adineta steineri TaxID=433720 RepID=A0A814BE66_9BILA|nr:unnamed protein product [Adineta steineri]CAF1264140.1 unnamed protein product [Adineta steineri]